MLAGLSALCSPRIRSSLNDCPANTARACAALRISMEACNHRCPPRSLWTKAPYPFPIMISRAQQCATRSGVKQVPRATARNFSPTLSISARNFRLALATVRRLRIIPVLRISKMRGVPAFRGAGGLPVGLTGAPRVGRDVSGARQALSHTCGGNSLRSSGYYASRKPGCAVSPCRHL